MPKKRLLAIRGGALGDFLCTLPAMEALKRRLDADLSLLTRPSYGELCQHFDFCQEWRSLEAAEITAVYAHGSPNSLTKWMSGFDAVASWRRPGDVVFEEGIRRWVSVEPLFFPSIVDPCRDTPAAHQLAGNLSLQDRLLAPFASPATTRIRRVAIHPGSGSQSKNWSFDSWLQLIGNPCWDGISFLVIAGEVEAAHPQFEEFRKRCERILPDCQFIVDMPLVDVAKALGQCAAFVGNDSGIAHLAAACGTPVLALFGPSNPAVWSPLGGTVLRSQSGSMHSIPVGVVVDRLREMINFPRG